jgi:K+-transporting ATPase ATPase C chain
MSQLRTTARTTGVAVRALLVLTLVLGVGYTLVVTGIGQLLMPWQANGSPVSARDGDTVGSALIGQSFTDAEGEALPEYFQSRPSAADYDGMSSGGSNLGPENADLIAAIDARRDQIAAREGVAADAVPADAVTASASGLDPHISPEYADLQVSRIAEERSMTESEVRALVTSSIQGRDLGFLGEERVNVVELNLALDAWEG